MCSVPPTRKLLQPGTALPPLERLKPTALTGTRLRSSSTKLTGAQREVADSHKILSAFIVAVYEGHIHTMLWHGRQEKALLLLRTHPAHHPQNTPMVQSLATTPGINHTQNQQTAQ
jgi:hypothetical protein